MYKNRTKTLEFHQEKELYYITFPSFEKTNLVNHCFSTRLGGVSEGIFKSLNLGFGRGDSEDNVKTNYKILCNAIGIDYDKLIFSDQVHETNIRTILKEDINDNFDLLKTSKEIDGLATNIPKVPLVTLYADCVPLFFLDPVAKAVGLAHAGWRGTVKKIGLEMIKVFKEKFNSNPKDILIGVGPSIGKCCFEVDKPVAEEFEKIFTDTKDIIYPKNNGKYMIDLWKANERILLEGGILPSNITVTDMCTKCNKDIFFSHRGHKGKRGNLAAIIELK